MVGKKKKEGAAENKNPRETFPDDRTERRTAEKKIEAEARTKSYSGRAMEAGGGGQTQKGGKANWGGQEDNELGVQKTWIGSCDQDS